MKKLQELHIGIILVQKGNTGRNDDSWKTGWIRQGEVKSRDYWSEYSLFLPRAMEIIAPD